jgi:hypothetical protein
LGLPGGAGGKVVAYEWVSSHLEVNGGVNFAPPGVKVTPRGEHMLKNLPHHRGNQPDGANFAFWASVYFGICL